MAAVLWALPRLGALAGDAVAAIARPELDEGLSWRFTHHIVQAVPVLLLMLVWPGTRAADWGLGTGRPRRGWRWVGGFALAWTLLYGVLTLWWSTRPELPQPYYDVTDARLLAGELVFRGLVVGPSEELLFRAFAVTALASAWRGETRMLGVRVPDAGILAAALFALAHLHWEPLSGGAWHADPLQLLSAMGLGLLYAAVWYDARSVWYPALIHAVSDLWPVLSLWALHATR